MSVANQKSAQTNKRVRLDPRVTQLIEQGVANKHRSIFLIVGDKSRELLPPLLQLLARARSEAQGMPSLLWCYKKDLGFTTHRKKRMKELQKKIRIGLIDPKEGDPWELFISSTNIRYCYYAETHKILGNTFGACVLQDFEALTPNLLARTIETVEGGGLVLILLRTLQSLKQLYTLTMDVHARYRTESHQDVAGRFNERFLLSLSGCHAFLALDDTYHVLPLSSKSLRKLPSETTLVNPREELIKLKDSLSDTKPLIDVLKCCCTLDQSKTLLKLTDSISDKTLRATIAITAARGRGKSACLGLALSLAIAFGYGAIFVTSPSPENLRTLFEFLFKGLDALSYEEHTDYEVLRSTNPEFKAAVTRLNVFREHRQIVQYIHPKDSHYLAHAELLVIDEAAAIPLPMVRKLMGPYLIFMASTVNGYEGTGRSLSLKLIDQLRRQCAQHTAAEAVSLEETSPLSAARLLHEVTLEEPIRYAAGDLVERWLHDLLCLDVNKVPRILSGCPSPTECDLYFVNRDTLFSYHKASEQFLHRLMSLYVSSHYRNTPNDLQLMSDAPAHKVFVLLGPTALDQTNLPEILCVMQVCLEGAISSASVKSGLSRGFKASGDLIPWTISEQFQDFEFCNLSGARVVRIATHPDYQGMGYGSRALSLLKQYYSGLIPCSEGGAEGGIQPVGEIDPDEKDTLISEQIKPRQNLPPLLLQLAERRAEKLDYLGVSYGVTEPLLKFWKRAGYLPVYLRQTPNELTGEYTVVMLQGLTDSSLPEWLEAYCADFTRRFIQLLSFQFREFPVTLALNVLYRNRRQHDTNEVNDASTSPANPPSPVTLAELYVHLTKYDLKRIHLYARHLVDYHLILDLLPSIARLYFLERTNFRLSLAQCAVLLGIGLQHKSPDDLSKEMEVPTTQLLGLFVRSIRKFSKFFKDLEESPIAASLPTESTMDTDLLAVGGEQVPLEQELITAAKEVQVQQARELQDFLQTDLSQYSVTGAEQDWEMALGSGRKQTIISIPSSAKRKPVDTDELLKEMSRDGAEKKMKKHTKRNK